MIRFALLPRWWAWHLALVTVLVSFGWLGWWQVSSFERAAPVRATTDVVRLDRVAVPGGRLGRDDIGRRVRAEGSWDGSGQRLVPDRERNGRSGVLVVTPLRTSAGVLPVLRGWAPGPRAAAAPPAGTVTVTGFLQRSETEADATVIGPPTADELPYVATVTVLEALPYTADELYDGFVVLTGEQPAAAGAPLLVEPRERQAPPSGGVGRWRNLAYGVQWWVFALAAVVFWASVIRRAEQERRRPPPDDVPRGPLVAPPRRT